MGQGRALNTLSPIRPRAWRRSAASKEGRRSRPFTIFAAAGSGKKLSFLGGRVL
ncbi:MAG: hypothetical protein BLITH_1061 [Brockia lithotrophica]|uniref:Uncharacterized protein n=1 Tax=Brockia lithotrophica TaxID=933949 RepID=A0A2T5G7D3_9BACL|nr:MAG: hypothetical protein BLITH_1061 [Brockia lithotrophica]